MIFLNVAGGILGLYLGGELLVRGAVRFSRILRIRPLVVGLTVVAFGTSAPELATSMVAAFRGAPDVVMGNVIGSNILNIGAVLGIAALIFPLQTTAPFLRREMPFMLGSCAILFLFVPNGLLGRLEGLLLFSLLCFYLITLYGERREGMERGVDITRGDGDVRRIIFSLLEIAAGIGILVLGASWLVHGAVSIARSYGVSERIIGLTMVAFGTSLPELASCVVAAGKKQSELVLGNLVGSSIFNVLAILGITALAHPVAVKPVVVNIDLLIMLGFGVVALALLSVGKKMKRWEGGLLLLLYGLYVVYLFT